MTHLRRSDITFNQTHLTIFIEKSKTDIYRDGNYSFIAKTNTALCPVETLPQYMVMAGICDESEDYIFRSVSYLKTHNRYILRKNNHPVSYTTARQAVRKLLGEIGLNPKQFGLHSLRSGGALAGANNVIGIMRFLCLLYLAHLYTILLDWPHYYREWGQGQPSFQQNISEESLLAKFNKL